MQFHPALFGSPVLLGIGGRPAEMKMEGQAGVVLGAEALVCGLSAATVFLVRIDASGALQTFSEGELSMPAPPVTAAAHERPPPTSR